MFKVVLRHVRRQPVAFVALFVALSTGAYAAASLPANSVGTRQIKNRAVTPHKLAKSTVKLLKGQTGPQGPTGQQGSTGPQGAPGKDGTNATITGVAAGGDLTGTYPNPTIAAGKVTNAKLQNASVTITPGAGLTGGGSVALGGDTSLTPDQTILQHRVTGTCPAGGGVGTINQDGTVACNALDYQIVTNNLTSTSLAAGAETVQTAACPTGKKVLGGGGLIRGAGGGAWLIGSSAPASNSADPDPTTWIVAWENFHATTITAANQEVYAICATVG